MIPLRLRAGTSADISINAPLYTAADGWAVKVVLQREGEVREIALTEAAGLWAGAFMAETTATWTPAQYRLYVVATKSPSVEVIQEDDFCLLPNPLIAGSRTALQSEMVLVDAAITAVLEGRGVKSYQIQTDVGSRQLERMTLTELRDHKNWLQRQIDQEAVSMGLKKPTAWRNIGTRFAR